MLNFSMTKASFFVVFVVVVRPEDMGELFTIWCWLRAEKRAAERSLSLLIDYVFFTLVVQEEVLLFITAKILILLR